MILDLLYPKACGFCGTINKNYICSKCARKIRNIEKNIIYKSKSELITYHGYIFKYEDIRDIIIDYKFNEKAYLYKTFSEIILKNEVLTRFIKKYDIIVPVPIHKKRKAFRGYDQTELIAKEIAKKLEMEIKTNVLSKKINIIPQSTLNNKDRKQNIRDAYELKRIEDIKNKKILLMDDIYTTGATIDECAKIIKKAGTKEVSAFTIAKD